jgi:hypothetical protein
VTLTNDIGKILTSLNQVAISGKSDLATGVQIAQVAPCFDVQLVLKHRENKNQKQRIIALVGSPIAEDEKNLVKLGKKLKKNNVAVDIVNFGEEALNTTKLQAFIDSVNSNDNRYMSHSWKAISCPFLLDHTFYRMCCSLHPLWREKMVLLLASLLVAVDLNLVWIPIWILNWHL